MLVACAAVPRLVNAYVAPPFLISSGSIEDTLRIGDRVLVDKLAYRFGKKPRRGDIVLFDGAGSFRWEENGSDYNKRVRGVGGGRVTCCDKRGRITVNGRPVGDTCFYPGNTPSRVAFDIRVPQGRLWVMGDHQDTSRVSRDRLGDPGGGTITLYWVIGRAEWGIWPLDHRRTPSVSSSLDAAHG